MVKQSLIFVKPGELRLDEYHKDDEPSETEVLIDVAACGICGSDLHWHLEGNIGPWYARKEASMGHEASGTVIKVGSKVTHLKPGDRVCCEPCEPCWTCDLCRIGSNNLCHAADSTCAGADKTGFFRTTNVWPAILCHKLPDNMTLKEGALVEPFACCIWAIRRAKLEGNEKILITGSGPIGIICLMIVKAFGASKVCITDLNEERLSASKNFGADYTLLVDSKQTPQQIAEKVNQIMGGPPDVAIDCTGVGSCINTGIIGVRRGGKVLLQGLGSKGVNVDLSTASLRQVDLLGVARYNNTFPAAIDLISSGRVNAKGLVSHIVSLGDYQQAFDLLKKGKGMKILLAPKVDIIQ
ncbi:sorbitol dehydrogenase [Tetranychus urticae]|uniref:Sorbitol dehydrogenase n=1 Tax=Tetranychus urticae TaxID=32264 RepID=T1K2P0_TETUR|nr:sorbitol dehydrogenase [Tetranychus urticae]